MEIIGRRMLVSGLALVLVLGLLPTTAFAEISNSTAAPPRAVDEVIVSEEEGTNQDAESTDDKEVPGDDSGADSEGSDNEVIDGNESPEGEGEDESDAPTEENVNPDEAEDDMKEQQEVVEPSVPLEGEETVESEQESPESGVAETAVLSGSIEYRAHVSSIGWQKPVLDGNQAGTTGRALAMEALSIQLKGVGGSLECQAHVAGLGWMKAVGQGTTAGTTGRGLAMQAVKIRLTGSAAELYDVYYQVHSAGFGWLGWARNGDPAGSAGLGLSMQAIKIKLVPKGSSFSGYGTDAFKENMITYGAHVSGIGWQSSVVDGAQAGTTGRALSLEALRVANASSQVSGSIVSQGYVQRIGWQAAASNGTIGTTGQARSLQAVKFSLEGALASAYDVYYRVHTSGIGWMGWAKNGAKAGTVGYDQAIESVQIRLVKKGSGAPGKTADAYRSRGLTVQAHSAAQGWLSPVTNNQTAGVIGKGRALEALCLSLGDQKYSGSIVYRAHVAGIGWQGAARDGAQAGTTGRALAIQAMRVKLEGEIANYYDVYYRMHSASVGWLDWAKNDAIAGTYACSLQAEAIQVVLVEKGAQAPGATTSPSRTLSYSYGSYVAGSGWQNSVSGGNVSGTTGKGRAIEQLTMSTKGSTFGGGLQYSVHSSGVGWQNYVNEGTTAGVRGKQAEAVRIRLAGGLSAHFDVWYRAHASGIGWMGWTKNGGYAGTASQGYRLEAIQLVIRPKGSGAPGSTARPFRDVWYTSRVSALLQNPELPTGCESVSLAIVLRSMGYGVAKTEIADFYLPKSSWDYVNAFAGDPRSSGGNYNAAMPPAIVSAANKYLSSHGAPQRAQNISGSSFGSLYSYIDEGCPVLVWTTIGMQPPLFYGTSLYGIGFYENEHCVVMYGYNRGTNRVLVSDPLAGITWRNASSFGSLYQRCGSMAVVIR